ncbi:AraC family transcriptional regulator [Leptospira barantonii]|uniref:AraC family transcriptional regulator n=2 Tax=Leptospira barantonii TaxID=2023184 RepID=A0A5F2BGK9_9LEPT|nr:AraC family transcriptional regulator [Leptospira barantonii]
MELFMTVSDLLKEFVLFNDKASTYLICIHASAIALSFVAGISEIYKSKKVRMNMTRGLVSLTVSGCLILNNVAISFLVSPAFDNPTFYHRLFFGLYYGFLICPCLWGMFYTMYLLDFLKSPDSYCNRSTIVFPVMAILPFVFPNMISFSAFGDTIALGVQATTCVWSTYCIFRFNKRKIFLNFPFQNLWMCFTFAMHIYGVSIRSADLLLIVSLIPAHIVIYFFILEYNNPGFTWKDGIKDFGIFETNLLQGDSNLASSDEKLPRRNLMEGVNLQIIENRIEKFVKEREFTDEDIRLPDFAAYLGLSVHQTSFYLNQFKKLNFPEFINYHRFETAKQMIQENSELNLLEIALACGFNSPSSFHRASIKFTGLPPRELKKGVRKVVELEAVSQ